ncbi:hypothetical protein GCM10010193_70730 [Kitasatospora atroaurantiaca]|uniref:D-inositol 3-phosphate glycosyltransferase n=1 Tax=Kitasatospora atroaurantiaca TaxID=285545 RepID=A0A561ENM1_9ACTN|nr:glycosyltransferase [Kitasatospora atroaurantiaca]TWE17159.1 glycosyltransferase involved in cell wall biosynthesis [Kitasatospora atroaurantiaca]
MGSTVPQTQRDVFGWLADRNGCGHLRIEVPLGELARHGVASGYSDRIPKGRQGELLIDPDLFKTVIAQRTCNPGPTLLWQNTARASRRPRLIYELDDDLLDIDPSNTRAHAFFSQPHIRANLLTNLAVADAVTVSTEALASVVRQHTAAPIHVIPNYLPAWLLDHERPSSGDDTVTIGWGGSSTHQMDITQIGTHLRRIMERNPHTELHLMGTNYAKDWGISDRVRFTEWTQSVPEYWRRIDYDVMLAPLRPHVFNASKSALRPLEAAALGIPVVASDYGPYAEFVRHGETGFLVKHDHEWGRYLRELVNDRAMREEMGAAGRRQAADWTVEGNVGAWAKVIEG